MADPFRKQKLQNWAAEFSDQDELAEYPLPVREYAAEMVAAFIEQACANRDVEPLQLTEGDLKAGLMNGPARLTLPQESHGKATEVCALFVAFLQRQGRMAAGRTLAPFVRALRTVYQKHSSNNASAAAGGGQKGKTFVKPGSPLGLNAPCPCGSGLKYKKCCKRLLG